ncbi:MAG: hypothetical protein GEU73_05080 [Chloroflexi bacterium]|nr:hypothetical protein [Chloroflexota bacterium]
MRKILGIETKYRGQRGNEESWGESPYLPGFRFEVKSGRMPALIRKAISQAMGLRGFGSTWTPAVAVVDSETDKVYAVVELEPLVNLARALAEMGQGSRVKSLTKDLDRITALIREAAS